MKTKHTPEKSGVEQMFESMFGQQELDPMVLMQNHLELTRQVMQWLMQREVGQKAGDHYSHEKPNDNLYSRWGSNPGSIKIGSQRVPVKVPRLFNNETAQTESPEVYKQKRAIEQPSPHVLKAILYGLSMRHFKETAEVLMESFGLSKSTLSDAFIAHSGQILEEFLERRLDDRRYVAMFIDGKVLNHESIIVAVGVDEHGEKRVLGLTQATTENAAVIGGLLRNMLARGLDISQGILAVIDGSAGIRSALRDVFGEHVTVQRCQVHKMRNIVGYLPKDQHPQWRKRLRSLFACADFAEATSMADAIAADLNKINVVASRSFQEGLDEILTITRLGLHQHLGKSFLTTNIIESTFSTAASMTSHIRRWRPGDQRLRWFAAVLQECELHWRTIDNPARLPMLQRQLLIEINRKKNEGHSDSTPRRFSTRKRT